MSSPSNVAGQKLHVKWPDAAGSDVADSDVAGGGTVNRCENAAGSSAANCGEPPPAPDAGGGGAAFCEGPRASEAAREFALVARPLRRFRSPHWNVVMSPVPPFFPRRGA